MRDYWLRIKTPMMLHALFLDPAVKGPLILQQFLQIHGDEVEGVACAPNDFDARWAVVRSEILEDMVRTAGSGRRAGYAAPGATAPPPPAVSTLTFGPDMDVMQLMDQRMLEAEQNSEWSARPAPNARSPDQALRMDCTQELRAFEDDASAFRRANPKWTEGLTTSWWSTNGAKYPNLAPIARRVLCVPVTSVPSERVFSTASHVNSKMRAGKIGPETARAMVVGQSLYSTAGDMGLNPDDAVVALSDMRSARAPHGSLTAALAGNVTAAAGNGTVVAGSAAAAAGDGTVAAGVGAAVTAGGAGAYGAYDEEEEREAWADYVALVLEADAMLVDNEADLGN
ncbi:Zinc finger BED domain-containing protein 1 [Allomyces javanicus]|nr:Zinc finger BED domain-containing protein 1 [Allomyces javanicus]